MISAFQTLTATLGYPRARHVRGLLGRSGMVGSAWEHNTDPKYDAGLTPETKFGKPRPSFLDVPSHTLQTVELLVGSEQAKTYGASFKC